MSRVVVVGAGLAGIAAALRLAELDWPVTLLETRGRLGGRATSFVDPRSGETLDNCQHVLLGCFTNLLDLYDRLGVLDGVTWHESLWWARGHGTFDEMRPGRWPAPLHMASAFRRARWLDAGDKRAVRRALLVMLRLGERGAVTWRGRPFGEFLASTRQPDTAVRRFWDPIVTGACNLAVERVAAEHAFKVFLGGFLGGRWAATMGLPGVPLAELYASAASILAAAGGEVRLGTSARGIMFDGRRVTGVVTGDERLTASHVISAVPFDRLARLVSDAARAVDRRLRELDRFDASPILGVHLRMPAPVMDRPHAILVERDVHWFFDKGLDDAGHQHVHAVVSAADDWMELGEDEIVARVLEDLAWTFPASRGLEPVAARAVKEKRATVALTPDAEARRPGAGPRFIGHEGGGIPNLALAGDWCDTGWPATMEGAVRSGYAAAEVVAEVPLLVEDVPAGRLVRWIGKLPFAP